MPFYQLFGGSPTKIDYRPKGTLILTSLLEDLIVVGAPSLLARGRVPGRSCFRVPVRCHVWGWEGG